MPEVKTNLTAQSAQYMQSWVYQQEYNIFMVESKQPLAASLLKLVIIQLQGRGYDED